MSKITIFKKGPTEIDRLHERTNKILKEYARQKERNLNQQEKRFLNSARQEIEKLIQWYEKVAECVIDGKHSLQDYAWQVYVSEGKAKGAVKIAENLEVIEYIESKEYTDRINKTSDIIMEIDDDEKKGIFRKRERKSNEKPLTMEVIEKALRHIQETEE